jgi:hypothetical protein
MKLKGNNWQKRAQDAEARAREQQTMYEAERKTVAELRDRLQVLERERETHAGAHAELERRVAVAKSQKERHESLLSHVKIALRACQRAKGRKKKGPSLRQAQAILEAAVDEDGHYATKVFLQSAPMLWAIAGGVTALAYMFFKGTVIMVLLSGASLLFSVGIGVGIWLGILAFGGGPTAAGTAAWLGGIGMVIAAILAFVDVALKPQ